MILRYRMSLKQLIQKAFRLFGYEFKKIHQPNLKFYKHFYSEESLRNRAFYNIGAGGFSHPFWTNIDFDSEWYSQNKEKTLSGIQYDLFSFKEIPVYSGFAEIVYSSHTFEHINDQAALYVFKEMYRILKKHGFLRITVPNIDLYYRAYRDKDRHFFSWIDHYSTDERWRAINYNVPPCKASLEQILLFEFASNVSILHNDGVETRIDDEEFRELLKSMPYEAALNHCCSRCSVDVQRKYPGNHINWWNANKLITMLKEAGFTAPYVSGYGQSHCPVLRNTRFFDNTHPELSLYIEAVK